MYVFARVCEGKTEGQVAFCMSCINNYLNLTCCWIDRFFSNSVGGLIDRKEAHGLINWTILPGKDAEGIEKITI